MASNKNSHALLTIPVLLLVMFTACTSKPAPKAWSKEYISNLHDRLGKPLEVIPDENQRNQVINCTIEKVRRVLPKGLESVSQDSAYSVIVECGDSCVHEIKNLSGVISWTEHNEEHLRTSISKTLNDTAVCDCFISKLKSKYPDGLPISQPISEKRAMVKECDSEVKEIKQGQDHIIKLIKKQSTLNKH